MTQKCTTSLVLGHKLAFFTRPTLRHVDVHASSRYRPLAATGEACFSIVMRQE
jgi:hypothetical protein